jgi:hypothetical protein
VTEDSLKRGVTRSDAFLANQTSLCQASLVEADPHRDNGKEHIVAADEKLTAFLELEWTIRG